MDTIERATELLEELKQHKGRLKARANEILKMAAAAPPDQAEVLKLVSQSFTEQVDTGLEFLTEAVEVLAGAVDSLGGDDGDIALEEHEVYTLLTPLTTHRGMLDELISKLGVDSIAERAMLQGKLDECLAAIKLVEDLSGEPEDGEGDPGDDEGDEGDAKH